MLTAISRRSALVLAKNEQLVAECKARGELIQGPRIVGFEAASAVFSIFGRARRIAQAMQIPVYSGLRDDQIRRVARVVRSVLEHA